MGNHGGYKQLEEVNRLLSFEALIFVPIVVGAIFVLTAYKKDWRALAVFFLAGVFNAFLEVFLVLDGTRLVDSGNIGLNLIVILELSLVDNGLFALVAYVNIRQWNARDPERPAWYVGAIDVLFFLGMPLASLDWGFLDQVILTRRLVANPTLQLVLQVSAVLLGVVILGFTGYKRLTGQLILMGVLLGASFESRLFLAGIRQASNQSLLTVILDAATLATMTMMAGAFVLVLAGKVSFRIYGDHPPLPERVMKLRYTLAAAKVLFRRLGLKEMLKVVKDMQARKKNGEPWKDFPSPDSEKDRLSRELIGDAILIYRVLLDRKTPSEATKIVREAIFEGAIEQLYALVPRIRAEEVLTMEVEARKDFLTTLIDKFPNADWDILEDQTTDTSFGYRITRCRLVEFFEKLGYPDLLDSCCPGDLAYFQRHQPDVIFERPANLGKGDQYCDFLFRLREPKK